MTKTKFTYENLVKMLKNYGEYPEKYRGLIWRYLLNLPLNKEAYGNLLDRGVHPAFEKLKDRYPIESNAIYNRLVRTLSGTSTL